MLPQEQNNNIDRIISAGFKPLAVKAGAEDQCIASILAQAPRSKPTPSAHPRILMFPTIRPVYLAAAALAMVFTAALSVSITIFSGKHSAPVIASAPANTVASAEQKPANMQASAVVATISAGAQEHKTANLGLRTTALVQGDSRMQVLKEDHEATVVEVAEGTVTFHVTPGGSDQVTVWAGTVVYRVVGTLFTVQRHNNESSLKVYRGTVSVDLAGCPASSIQAGGTWSTARPGSAGTFNVVQSELETLSRLLGLPINKPAVLASAHTRSATPAPVPSVVQTTPDHIALEAALNKTRQHLFSSNLDSLELFLSTISHNAVRETVFQEIVRMAQQKVVSRQFVAAEKVYEKVIAAWPTTMQSQDALLSILTIREQRGSTPVERLDVIQTYLAVHPDGRYAPELLQKQVQLLRKGNDIAACREAAHRFVVSFPDHPAAAELLFLSATLLRENLQQTEQALFEYRTYLTRYPGGKHAEDVMYWAIKLGEISPSLGQK